MIRNTGAAPASVAVPLGGTFDAPIVAAL